jgi:hypothetical protein
VPSATPTSPGGVTPFPTSGPSPQPSTHPTPKPTVKVTPTPLTTPQPTTAGGATLPPSPSSSTTTTTTTATTTTMVLPYTGTTANTSAGDPARQGGDKVGEGGGGGDSWVAIVIVLLVVVCLLLAVAAAAVAHRRRRRAAGQLADAIPMSTVAMGKGGPGNPASGDVPPRPASRSRQHSRAISRSTSRPGALRRRSGSYSHAPVVPAGAYEIVPDTPQQYETTSPMYARPSGPPQYSDVAVLRSRQAQAPPQYAGATTVQTRLGLGPVRPGGRPSVSHVPVRPPTPAASTQQYVAIPTSGYVPFPGGQQAPSSTEPRNTQYVNMPPRRPPPRE